MYHVCNSAMYYGYICFLCIVTSCLMSAFVVTQGKVKAIKVRDGLLCNVGHVWTSNETGSILD